MNFSKWHQACAIFAFHMLYVVFLYDFITCLYETVNGIDVILFKNNYGGESEPIAFGCLSDLIRGANPYVCSIFLLMGVTPFFLLKKYKINIMAYILVDLLVSSILFLVVFYVFLKHIGSFIWVM